MVDTALLLALLDRPNRRRLALPLLLVVTGAWLYHGGGALHLLLAAAEGVLSEWLNRLALFAVLSGALLMPCALLHGLLRADTLGWRRPIPDWRHGLLYLPLLVLLPLIASVPEADRLGHAIEDWRTVYVAALSGITLVAGIGFFRLQAHFVRPWARRFMVLAGSGLLLLTALLGTIFFVALPLLPAWRDPLLLLAALSPLPLVMLVGYFIIRFNFLQLVLGRVFVYGVLVVAVVLFHQVFLRELWQVLSEHYRIDFALVSGLAIAALFLAVPSLRNRSAEALRYLLGRRIDLQRQRSRELVIAMAGHCGEAEAELLTWFVDAGRRAFGVRYLEVWLCDAEGRITDRAGAVERLSDTAVAELLACLRAARQVAGRLGAAPGAVEDGLLEVGAAAVVRLDHPAVDGLVLVGHGPDEWHEERLTTLVLVVEQLAITLHTGRLQAERLAAERRALQQDKLATLGLVASSVAHEVKNPLSSIRTLATLMAEEQPPDAPHAEDLRQMIGELDRLALSVNQLLQFSRPGGDDRVGADPVAVLNGIVRILRHLATRRGLILDVSAPATLPAVRLPAGALREILFNLLGNAIEAARSRVALHCRPDGDAVLIELSDDGPGIPEALRTRLFQPFVTGRAEGTGLGLYLVGRHVQDWGGRIDCCSAPEQGTLFRLRLPLMRDVPDRPDRR